MLGQLFKYGNVFTGVEHTYTINGESVYNILTLKQRKKELTVLHRKQFLTQDEVYNFILPLKHVFLVINSKQVLSKKSEFNGDDFVASVQNTFQNLNLNDFYSQVDMQNNEGFVSICRKDDVDEILQNYAAKKIGVVGFLLGNRIVENICSYVKNDVFYISNAKIIVEEGKIATLESAFENENYIINDLKVSSNDIVSLSAILFGYFLNGNTKVGFQEKNTALQKEFLNKRTIKLAISFSLGLLFFALLINFMLFNSYSTKINQLNSSLSVQESQKVQVNTLKSKILTKEKLIEDLNNVLQSEISKYIDEIAVSVPKSILLDAINYQPVYSSIRPNKEIAFNLQTVLVKGATKIDADFSLWTESLGQKEWIKEIIINDFSNGKKGTSNFEFLIQIKNDK